MVLRDGLRLLAFLAVLGAEPLQAQQDTLVEARRGRLVTAMGQPSPWSYYVAGDFGLQPIDERLFSGQFSLGAQRSLLNPLTSLLSISGEYFMGARGNARGQVGFRAGVELPVLRVGAGWQYEFRTSQDGPYLTLRHPVRRGGVLWPGGQLRLLWTPGADAGITLGATVPVAQPFAGRSRPRRVEAVVPLPLAARGPERAGLPEGVERDLAEAGRHARRLGRLYVPHLGPPTAAGTDATVVRALGELGRDLADPVPAATDEAESVPVATVRAYHAAVERAFRTVGQETGVSTALLAAAARRAMLEEVVLPFNRFLGRKKADDTFDQLAARARVAFARELVIRRGMSQYRIESAEAVFDRVLEIVRAVEHDQARVWDDDRLVFLPLQLALLPEEHDSQAEILDLVGRAVEQPFTRGNRAWYVVDEQFQWELLRMIHDTRNYHVLWIHDFRGFDDQGDPDAVAFRTVVDGYLDALADRVEAYDREGFLPVYMILIDQFFYEVNTGRVWLSLLEDPLHYEMDLPEGHEEWEAEIRRAQARLRRAVAESRLLQAEAREYGQEWLRNRVRVQVNVTNPADATFWAWELIPWVGLPDALIRDHRKISFFDVDPGDPSRGRALYTGMGVGEHYNGPTWDDRALLIEGPVLASLRDAARELLLQQGFAPDQIPYPLQDSGSGGPGIRAAAAPADTALGAWMLEAHNLVGYGEKAASVMKATLYCLMPPGSVVKAPDSLWNFSLWGSLLTGLSLRGGRVLVVAPSYEHAPAQAFGSMALAKNLLGQLVAAGRELESAITDAGGLLRVGMYQPDANVGDLPGKARQMAATFEEHGWLRELYGYRSDELARVTALADSLEAAGFQVRYLDADALEAPKLHMKAHFFATGEAWDPLIAVPESRTHLLAYLQERAFDLGREGADRDLRRLQEALQPSREAATSAWLERATPQQQERAAWLLLLGSQNQNYRSALLDGEVLVAIAGADATIGLPDFTVVVGLSEWIDDPEALDGHFPELSRFMRGAGLWARIIF